MGYMLTISALRRWRQGNQRFKIILGYTVSMSQPVLCEALESVCGRGRRRGRRRVLKALAWGSRSVLCTPVYILEQQAIVPGSSGHSLEQ